MATDPNAVAWDPLSEPRDYVEFGGRRTPGIAEIVGASSPRQWDERGGYALSGAVLVYHGLKLAHFSVRLRLYTQQDWRDWDDFRPLVQRAPLGTRQGPIDVVHPLLEQVGIRSCVVEDFVAPEQTGDGEWTIVINLIEYRSPRFALAKPEGAQATPVDPDIQAALDTERENRAQIDALSGPQS